MSTVSGIRPLLCDRADKAVDHELRNPTDLNQFYHMSQGHTKTFSFHIGTVHPLKFKLQGHAETDRCGERLHRRKMLNHAKTMYTNQIRECDYNDVGLQYQVATQHPVMSNITAKLQPIARAENDNQVALSDSHTLTVKPAFTHMTRKLQPITSKTETVIHRKFMPQIALPDLASCDGRFISEVPEVIGPRQGAGSVSPQFYTSLQGYKSYLRHEKGIDPGEVNWHMRGVFATLIHHEVATSSMLSLSMTLKEIVGLRRGSAPPLDFVFRILSSKFWLMEADEWADLLIICRWANPTTINCKNCGPETEAILTSCNHFVCRSCTLEQFKDKQNSTCPECHEVVTGISFDLSSNSTRECVKRKRSEECEDHEVESSPGKRKCLTSLRSTKVCTIEELKNHTGVSDNQLEKMIPEEHLYDLAGLYDEVGMNLYTLRLTPSQRTDVKGLVHDGTHTAMLKALELWRKPNPLTATYRSLLDVVLHMQRGDIALNMCEYIKSKV